MKYFQLEGIIKEDLLNNFMNFWNTNHEDDLTVVINSGGGKSTLMSVILHIINANHDKFTLISAGCYSAAFELFYFAKCKKSIIYGSIGMCHKEYLNDISINADNKPVYRTDECQIKNLDCFQDQWILKILNEKEKRRYKKSDDVYFTFKRMTEIFPAVPVISNNE